MRFSFTITETMSGVHHFVEPSHGDPSDRSLYFRLDWGPERASALNPWAPDFLEFPAQGVIFVEGLTPAETPCRGSLKLDYFRSQTLTYNLDFEVGGRPYHYVGQKQKVNLANPVMLVKTHTTCYGTLTDAQGRVISRSIVHFEPDTLPAFLASFRLRRGGEGQRRQPA
jgi:hypothetical protein